MKQMTLEEKAGMCSGEDFWHLKSVERLGIPSVMVSDGPHGLRKQDQGQTTLEQMIVLKQCAFQLRVRQHAHLTETYYTNWERP